MEYVTLGRTGLRVSVMGLGGGGHSRLGQQTGRGEAESIALVQRALELGVNFIDTAEAYGTEAIVGQAIQGHPRDQLVLSTKKTITHDSEVITAAELVHGLDASLQRLGTDYVDIYHLHGVREQHYDTARDRLVPALQKLREQGKIRFLGITEAFSVDPGHRMLSRAVQDNCWDVVMVGFNILNQCARERVLVHTNAKQIGVLAMFAVRQALSRPEKLRQTIAELLQQGLVDPGTVDQNNPLGFLLQDRSVLSVPDAAYRFCRAEPGIDVVLSGTGNVQHLEENIASILRPPLPERHRQRLMRMFERVNSVSGQ